MCLLPSLERDVDAVELDAVGGGGIIVYNLVSEALASLLVAALLGLLPRLLPRRREGKDLRRYQLVSYKSEHLCDVSV
jgi:hypothetical protein